MTLILGSLSLYGCASDEQMGLCTELGLCSDCKKDDGSCDSADNPGDHSVGHDNTETSY